MESHPFYPKLSIVTPSFNQADYLEECIDSVLGQNYPNLEYIIIDGGSTDASVEIIKKYQKYLKFWESTPDKGHYDGVNKGFRYATGEILAWLNSDDKYHPNSFYRVASILLDHPEISWLMGRPTGWDPQGKLSLILPDNPQWSRQKLLDISPTQTLFIQQESTFWRSSLWNTAGGHVDEAYELAGDFDLWMRFSRYTPLYYVDALIGGFRSHSDQRSKINRDQYMQEVLTIIEREKQNFSDLPLIPPPQPVSLGSQTLEKLERSKEKDHSLRVRSGQTHPTYLYSPEVMQTEQSTTRVRLAPVGETAKLLASGHWDFNYSKKSHFRKLKSFGPYLGIPTEELMAQGDLKCYQDLLMYTFITENLLPGARLLEIGGGNSRIAEHLHDRYEIWNIDKFEGLGNGPTEIPPVDDHTILDYIGNFNHILPDGYFDLVFSISVLEHLPEEAAVLQNVMDDIHRVLKPGGISIHCLDVVDKGENVYAHPFIEFARHHARLLHSLAAVDEMVRDPDLYTLTQKGYQLHWETTTQEAYETFGQPISYNLAWQKPSIQEIASEDGEKNGRFRKTSLVPSEHPYKVTAIVSTYQSEAFIGECLTDLLDQTISDQVEIIVVDAASPEQEASVVKHFQETNSNIVYLRTDERIGVYSAWNLAILHARGKYITPMSTNDRLSRDACEKMASYLDDHPEIMLVYGDSWLTLLPHETFSHHIRFDAFIWPEFSYAQLRSTCLVGPHPMWRKAIHEEVGYFDERYLAAGDQEFWLRMGRDHPISHIPFVTGLYWVTSNSLSAETTKAPSEIQDVHRYYANQSIDDGMIRDQYIQMAIFDMGFQKGRQISLEELNFLISRCEALETIQSNNFAVLESLAYLYAQSSDHSRSIEHAQLASRIHPERWDLRCLLIDELLQNKDISQAQEELFALIQLVPNRIETQLSIGKYLNVLLSMSGREGDLGFMYPEQIFEAKLYINAGDGYNESLTVWNRYVLPIHGQVNLTFNLGKVKNQIGDRVIRSIRFDPCEGRVCRCKIEKVTIDSQQGDAQVLNSGDQKNGWDEFLTLDPMYELMGDIEGAKKIEVCFNLEIIVDLNRNFDYFEKYWLNISDSKQMIRNKELAIIDHELRINEMIRLLSDKDSMISEEENRIAGLEAENRRINGLYESVINSNSWKTILHLGTIVAVVAPKGSKRRKILALVINKLR